MKMPRKRRLLSGQVRRRHRARRWCFALSDRVKGLVLLYGRRRSSQAQMSGNGRRGGRRIVAGQAANARDPTGQGQIRLRFREAAAYAHRSCSARRLLLAFGGVFFWNQFAAHFFFFFGLSNASNRFFFSFSSCLITFEIVKFTFLFSLLGNIDLFRTIKTLCAELSFFFVS